MRNYEQADQTLQYALDLDPDYALAQYNLAVSLAEQRQIDRAVQYLELALYNDANLMQIARTNPVFASLSDHPGFSRLLNLA